MSELIIKTTAGQVEGALSIDGDCRIFKGIPYAEPPVGNLRFKRAEPKKPWNGIRPAKAFSPKAYQADLTRGGFYAKEFYFGTPESMSEDCLYLNIWTPKNTGNQKLPVMMWIHGGAYMHGAGSEVEFDGEGFAKKGVILVTINYRVGALGFFAHNDLEKENPQGISGNYGFWDQISALKWIYENIESFGGDKEKITVAGQSAGCMSTQTLVSTSETKGLINSAILQSGGGIPGFARDYSVNAQKEISLELMEHLGITTIEELRALSPEAITYGAYDINARHDGLCWMPNIDGYLLKDTVPNLAINGDIHSIPYIIGCTKDEMGNGSAELLYSSAKAFAENQDKLGNPPVYVYHFERDLPGDDAKAFHSSELWYEFETLGRCWRPFEKRDWDLSAELATYFTNFIKHGKPNEYNGNKWNKYTIEKPEIYIFK